MEFVCVPFCRKISKNVQFSILCWTNSKEIGYTRHTTQIHFSNTDRAYVLTGGEKILIVLIILLLVAVFTDYHSGKIPNRLIVAGILIGIVTTKDLGGGILRLLAVCICFFPFFSIGALGAGDVKCIAMTGLFLQQELLLQSILYTFIIAAIFSIVKLWFSRKKITQSETIKTQTIHLALPIFLGVLLAIGGTYL